MENEEVLLLRVLMILEWIFRSPELRYCFLQHVAPEQYDFAQETWYLLHEIRR